MSDQHPHALWLATTCEFYNISINPRWQIGSDAEEQTQVKVGVILEALVHHLVGRPRGQVRQHVDADARTRVARRLDAMRCRQAKQADPQRQPKRHLHWADL